MPELNERLQSAVHNIEVPPYLEARIRARLDAPEPSWGLRLIPIAAALCVMVAVGAFLTQRHFSEEEYISEVSAPVSALMRVGLGDHVHCSYFHKFPANPPTVEELVRKMGPTYAALIPVVRRQVPENCQLVMAHECSYHNRKFVHLTLKSDTNLMSLVIARKGPGETFGSAGVMQAASARFQIASFEDRDYLVYFISDLSPEKNSEMMRAMAPGVRAFLAKLES
jgi:hypothetical protein